MAADIDCLPGIPWNAHAALHDALNRCPQDASVLIVWTDKDCKHLYHSANSTNAISAWMLHYALNKLL